jgi:hypothetical protein
VEVLEVTLEMEEELGQVVVDMLVLLELPIMVMMVLAVAVAVVDIIQDMNLVVEAVESVFSDRDLMVLGVQVEVHPL